ncbi:hypothetical protein CRENBAI_003752 [Crenichthys baileyi]|uniref:Uncharacterized protein n=1 Tax=Crenichthys baileyi TaxID=28760 RepID=A0AAV9RND1_9TELE
MQSISCAVSLVLLHQSIFFPSDLVRWSSARKNPVPSSSIAFIVQMLSPVSPLLGFSVIAQPTLLSFSVIAQYFSHGRDFLVPFFGLEDTNNSRAAGCNPILPSFRWSSKDSLSACSWLSSLLVILQFSP